MEMQKITFLSTVVIAFATFIGVAGATVFYMKQLIDSTWLEVSMAIVLYTFSTLFIILLIYNIIPNGKR